jgi:hypothetical protein
MRFKFCSHFRSVGNYWMDNLRPDETLRWKVENRRLGRSGSVMWQAGTFKAVTLTCVS